MPRFNIHEVQHTVSLYHLRHEVEADTKEEALEKAMNKQVICSEFLGPVGDTEYGDSGFGHTCDEAFEDYESNSPTRPAPDPDCPGDSLKPT